MPTHEELIFPSGVNPLSRFPAGEKKAMAFIHYQNTHLLYFYSNVALSLKKQTLYKAHHKKYPDWWFTGKLAMSRFFGGIIHLKKKKKHFYSDAGGRTVYCVWIKSLAHSLSIWRSISHWQLNSTITPSFFIGINICALQVSCKMDCGLLNFSPYFFHRVGSMQGDSSVKLLVCQLRREGDLGLDLWLSESSEWWLKDGSLFLQCGRQQEG